MYFYTNKSILESELNKVSKYPDVKIEYCKNVAFNDSYYNSDA